MKRFLVFIAVLAIAGCAATSKTEVKRGKKGLHINCSGLTSSWEKCEKEATAACGSKGYKVMAKAGSESGEDDPADFVFGLNPAGFSSRSLIVLCK